MFASARSDRRTPPSARALTSVRILAPFVMNAAAITGGGFSRASGVEYGIDTSVARRVRSGFQAFALLSGSRLASDTVGLHLHALTHTFYATTLAGYHQVMRSRDSREERLPDADAVRRGRRFRASVAPLALAVVAFACSGESATDPVDPTVPLRLVTVPAGDTVGALLTQPLVVQVREPGVTSVVFRANMVEHPVTGPQPGVRLSRASDGQSLALVDTVATDAEGRASVYLRLGTLATDAVVTVLAPATRDSVQARITVRPGAPIRLDAYPGDTAMYVGHSYPLEARLFDSFDNPIAIDGLTFTTDSASVAITDEGNVTGVEIGRAGIVAHDGALADTVWASVVPEGRIAAVEYGGSGGDGVAVVLVNLDGSDYRRFPLGQFDIPRPAWHPSGAYLVASIHAAPGAPDAAPRLAALDTSTGEWHALGGTPDAAGDGYAQFSHDGAWIYVANAPTNEVFSSWGSSVYRVHADGSGDAEIVGYDNATDASEIFDHPSPSPDGSRVAMTVDGSSGTYTLIVAASPPLGEVPQQATLLDGLPTGGYPTWSPVGDDILMFGTEGMWIMRAGAQSVGDRRYLASEWSTTSLNITGGFSGASWSPDAHWIVARSHAGMILVEVATDRVLPLALGGLLSNPAWRPQ